MDKLIGTVHKPPTPDVPEPEGWIPLVLERERGENSLWVVPEGVYKLVPTQERATELMEGYVGDIRLVRVGPAPKPPVEAIGALARICAQDAQAHVDRVGDWIVQTEDGSVISVPDAITTVRSWLAEQEEGDK